MAEKKTPAEMFMLNYECDVCLKGFMMFDSSPFAIKAHGKFAHKCNNENCGHKQHLEKQYPLMITELKL